jgi:hypothetical protein
MMQIRSHIHSPCIRGLGGVVWWKKTEVENLVSGSLETTQSGTLLEYERAQFRKEILKKKSMGKSVSECKPPKYCMYTCLKRLSHEIFHFWFFHKSTAPRPLVNTIKYFWIPFRIRRDIRRQTVEKLIRAMQHIAESTFFLLIAPFLWRNFTIIR